LSFSNLNSVVSRSASNLHVPQIKIRLSLSQFLTDKVNGLVLCQGVVEPLPLVKDVLTEHVVTGLELHIAHGTIVFP
jgi:hypothetical protein